MTTNKTMEELKRYVDTSKYDINARVQMIIDEVQRQMKQWEDEARKMYGLEESSTFSEINPTSQSQNGK